MSHQDLELSDFGWTAFYASQIEPGDPNPAIPARVMAVHRDKLHVAAPGLDARVPPLAVSPGDEEAAATVGDWLLLDPATLRPRRLLARRSLFKRRAAGKGRRLQLIAANVDTLLVVSSCNQDFNVARLERYLALAKEAGVTPLLVLSKADLADNASDFAHAARKLMPGLLVETIDARDPAEASVLAHWCGRGQTVAFVGSSGVGKSTLVNTLIGSAKIATQGIREDDGKGRHTTTGRAMHRLAGGGWLIDTPGMRELQLTDASAGVGEVFADIAELAEGCRFADCGHESEPGCAVQAAIMSGDLDAERFARWRKLAAEEAFNSESLLDRRSRDRAFGRMVRRVTRDKARRRGD